MILFQGKKNNLHHWPTPSTLCILVDRLALPCGPLGETSGGHPLSPTPPGAQVCGSREHEQCTCPRGREDRGKVPRPNEVSGQRVERTPHLLQWNARETGPEKRKAVRSTNWGPTKAGSSMCARREGKEPRGTPDARPPVAAGISRERVPLWPCGWPRYGCSPRATVGPGARQHVL